MEYGALLPDSFYVPKSFFWIRKDLETNPFSRLELAKGDRVMDCGAAIGTFAAAALESGAAAVRCYEPHPKNFEVLAKNLARYGDRAGLVQAALCSTSDDFVDLHVAGFSGSHTIVKGTGKRVRVRGVNFRDELLSFLPHVVKLDIEGGEYDLLASLLPGDLVSVRSIVVEFHPFEERERAVAAFERFVCSEGLIVVDDRKRAFTAVRRERDALPKVRHAPQFPIYIPSKGRWESRLTMKALDGIGLPYHVVVEPQELDAYSSFIDPSKLLVLDLAYKDRYDTFSARRAELGTGSGPARNFAWDHAMSRGFGWYWCIDDNIRSFHRYQRNLKVPVADGAVFRAMEDFCLRYENVAMAGPNYFGFVSRKSPNWPPFVLNTRIYSCNLIRCDVPFRWRGRYNEDTDLSLRLLKAGWCTVLFNAFIQDKMPTMKLKGGNTDSIYTVGTADKSKMLVEMHPDVARIARRFGRVHHYVDYSRFMRENRLVLKPGVEVGDGPDDYGMVLRPSDGAFLARTTTHRRRSPASSTTG